MFVENYSKKETGAYICIYIYTEYPFAGIHSLRMCMQHGVEKVGRNFL
jgi:hypothetical protein